MSVGPGVAFFFAPANAYISGSVNYSELSLSSDKDRNNDNLLQSNGGIGTSITIGKEWWVSSDWSLGAAFRFQHASMKFKDSGAWMNAFGFGLFFSATYN